MIPTLITKGHIVEAMLRIGRKGVPPRRKGQKYCVDADGGHFPPKYTITVAHKIATGKGLRSNKFSGGTESNGFLKVRGFDIVDCNCGGSYRAGGITSPSAPLRKTTRMHQPSSHSEQCPDCKTRVRELLERIYGKCLANHGFSWPAQLSSYKGTSIFSALQSVVRVLEEYRGFCSKNFVRAKTVAPCDFWVPDPGFVVEFDESQHFTAPRKLALSMYPDDRGPGFSREYWTSLCEMHNARDNDPPFRDEQRAWYDTLRDLVPSLKGFQPTVRLYARDFVWCSLDPENSDDRRRFSDIVFHDGIPAGEPVEETGIAMAPARAIVRVALAFPKVNNGTSHGIPPGGKGAQEPDVPSLASFHTEAIDFVLFPEAYVSSSDSVRIGLLSKLASDLNVPMLVGAVERHTDSTGGRSAKRQVLLRFDPDGHYCCVYTKHSTAEAVAFEEPDWDPDIMLPTFELGGARVGATVCHDHYLGLLPRFLARRGACIWVNPTFDNVTNIKWSSILRLRAVENRFFALCTLHDNGKGRSTHPFAFSPAGQELLARQVGCSTERPLSKCNESGTIYIVDLDMDMVRTPLDWSQLPPAEKTKRDLNVRAHKPVRVALRDGVPAVFGRSGWQTVEAECPVETRHGSVYVGVVPNERMLDTSACFRVLDCAKKMGSAPIIWNHWDQLPARSCRLATLMMGRTIECCAPILLSDRAGIHELVELSNRNKMPARRTIKATGEAIVDMRYAWGLDNVFKIVTKHLPAGKRRRALDRYRGLA